MSTIAMGPRELRRGRALFWVEVSDRTGPSAIASVASCDNCYGARLINLESTSPARQRRVGHEIGVRRERIGIRRLPVTLIGAVASHVPALRLVLEQRHHDLIQNLLMYGRVFDRNQCFNTSIEISRHPIGG